MTSAQQIMEGQENKSRNPSPLLHLADKVWLNLKNIQTLQPKKKLACTNARYIVTKIISTHVVELDVPSKTWPRSHVDLLQRASTDHLPSQQQDDLQTSLILGNQYTLEAEPEQTVEKILRTERVRRGKGSVRLLVNWKELVEPIREDRSEFEEGEALDKFVDRYRI